jgi:hypothetical protein
MIKEKFIEEILDPKTKEVCEGFVTVMILNDVYYFTPYLNCGINYITPGYDKTDYVLPVINLMGDNPIIINIGESYVEPGFTAYDDVDGEITNKVIIMGTINPNISGTYEIIYSVTDNANNLCEVTRTVNVIEPI